VITARIRRHGIRGVSEGTACAGFLSRFDTIRQYRFDDEFRRTSEFYMAYSQAGFAAGYLNLG
jgi:hypothetical protein